ncbi:MAG: T9SS type A sorting domain-containing protein [bacterium]|nr:T9SS type A sorting domain-containing protein [bacterium]
MHYMIYSFILTFILAISSYSTTVNGRFSVVTNNGTNYSVTVQLNTDTGTDDLGGSTIVFNFNNLDLSFPFLTQSGVDYIYHNFSGGNYSTGTVTRPLPNQIWLNIELNVDNGGTIVPASPNWIDVVTINFTTLDPSGNAGLVWQESDGNWYIFDGDNANLWDTGVFADENTTPLPVELTSFTSKYLHDKVQLNWVTKTEVNNYGFNVERRINEGEWNSIGFVEGHGNSNSPKEYSYIDKDLFAGGSKFHYRLKQVDTDGTFEYSDVVEVEVMPTQYELSQNYPNPFNPSTTIRFSLPRASQIKIELYNIVGEQVATLADGMYESGYHKIEFNASGLTSGTYIYRLSSDSFVQTKKMMILK